ncbi:MAG: hypothetical protein BRC23_01830 [Parcubacteria group bacterium SW_4_49_11]|jgi:hypothetical protein|nr:MAG: hypothetical protein BRC23_01830 [Parcubacteria group bacterium SW_4_49_11]
MALSERDISREIDRIDFQRSGGLLGGGTNTETKRKIVRDKLETRLDRASSEERGFFGARETVTEEELNNVVNDLREYNDFTEEDISNVEEHLKGRMDNNRGGLFS